MARTRLPRREQDGRALPHQGRVLVDRGGVGFLAGWRNSQLFLPGRSPPRSDPGLD